MTITRRQFVLGAGAVSLLGACDVPTRAKTLGQQQVGVYLHNTAAQSNPVAPTVLASFEAEVGRRFGIIHYFLGWGTPFTEVVNTNVPSRDLMISWDPGTQINPIRTGTWDAYIADWGRAAKAYGHIVYVRFGAEMNGDWSPYSAGAPGGPTAAQYILAWHRVAGILRAVSAHNVRLIWCPTEIDFPATPGNRMEDYWPGSSWVDVLAFDGYNWGTSGGTRGGEDRWRTFDEICAGPYQRIAALDKRKPIWVAEVGCATAGSADPPGATKGGWLTDMLHSTTYRRLAAVVYFSADTDRDWRIVTPGDIAGWRAGWL